MTPLSPAHGSGRVCPLHFSNCREEGWEAGTKLVIITTVNFSLVECGIHLIGVFKLPVPLKKVVAVRRTLEFSVFVFHCCKKNYYKFRGFKELTFIISQLLWVGLKCPAPPDAWGW